MLWQEHFDLGHAGLKAVEDYFPFFPIPPLGWQRLDPAGVKLGWMKKKKKKKPQTKTSIDSPELLKYGCWK